MNNEKNLTMRECVRSAAILLGLDSVISALDSGNPIVDAAVKEEISRLVVCGNLVIDNIAADYIPLKVTEVISTANERVKFDSLSKNVVEIYRVTQGGKSARISVKYDGIIVPCAGEYEVEYSFKPATLALEGVSPYSAGKPSARIVAYGIATEYCLIQGMTDDALVWDKRFIDSITMAICPKNERKVRARKWI